MISFGRILDQVMASLLMFLLVLRGSFWLSGFGSFEYLSQAIQVRLVKEVRGDCLRSKRERRYVWGWRGRRHGVAIY